MGSGMCPGFWDLSASGWESAAENSLFPVRFFLGRLSVAEEGFEAGITWKVIYGKVLTLEAAAGISFPASRGGGGSFPRAVL